MWVGIPEAAAALKARYQMLCFHRGLKYCIAVLDVLCVLFYSQGYDAQYPGGRLPLHTSGEAESWAAHGTTAPPGTARRALWTTWRPAWMRWCSRA